MSTPHPSHVLPTTLPDSPQTLGGYLLRAAELARPHAGVRLLDRRERETWLPWEDLVERAQRAAGRLRAAGVRPGERVAIVLPTGAGFLDAFFGCTLLGAVPTPLYPPVRLGRLEEFHARTAAMLAAAGCVALVTEARIHRLMGQTLVRYPPRCGVVRDTELLEGEALQPAAVLSEAGVTPESLCLVQFSSGTTVDPKPVALSHRAVLAQVHAIMDQIRLDTPDEVPLFTRAGVSWLPLYHDMGLIGGLFPAAVFGAPTTLIGPEVFLARPATWLRAISRYRGTISPAPDFAYALCTERIRDEELEGVDLSCWSLALNGAEPIRARTLRAFSERFAPWGFRPSAMTPVYGLSEAALAVTFSPVGEGPRVERYDPGHLARGRAVPAAREDAGTELVSVGRPVAGFSVEIRDDAGEVLPEGHVGRIWAQGPSLMTAYLDREEQPVVDGWLDTGDLGFLREGRLTVTGRAKDVIVLRGQNHAPHELEQAVDEVPGVRTGCAAAVSRIEAGEERVLVFVEARQPSPRTAPDCRRAIRARTGVDVDLVVVLEPGTLPRTSSGKIRRRASLERWEAGTLSPPDRLSPWMLAGAFARSALGFLGQTR